jgi:hypothetical protein
MKKQLFSLGLLAIFTMTAAIIPSVKAQENMDPRDRGCDKDAEVLTSTSGGEYSTGILQTMDVRIELRKSEKCQGKWVRAYVPKGTELYLKDESGEKRGSYTAKVNGWNYGDMWNSKDKLSACAKLPNSNDFCTNPV